MFIFTYHRDIGLSKTLINSAMKKVLYLLKDSLKLFIIFVLTTTLSVDHEESKETCLALDI